MRGATSNYWQKINKFYFNPRSSCEERRGGQSWPVQASQFQSTLLMRGATGFIDLVQGKEEFQSTLLMRGATLEGRQHMAYGQFQSTLLMRGATQAGKSPEILKLFQSTLLMRGATLQEMYLSLGMDISIHAPHARSDTDFSSCKTVN